MRTAMRLSACSVCVLLGLPSWGFDAVTAEPSAFCRDLAARFANSQMHLDVRSLARLGTRVITELGEVAGTAELRRQPQDGLPLHLPSGRSGSPASGHRVSVATSIR
jgi:hypothetical protein